MKNILQALFISIIAIPQLYAQDEASALQEETTQAIEVRKRPEGRTWYVSGQVGYGIPFLTSNMRSPFSEIGDKIYYHYGNDKSIKAQYNTNGNGLNGTFAFGHMWNKFIGIEASFMMVNHPEVTNAEVISKSYQAYQKTHTLAWYLSPTLLFHHQYKKFGITTKLGPFIPIGGIVSNKARIYDETGRLMTSMLGLPIKEFPSGLLVSTFEGNAKTHLVPTIGMKAAIALEYKFNDKYVMFFEANAGVYNIKIKETEFESLKLTASLHALGLDIPVTNLGIDKLPEYLKHYVWVDEITEESNNLKYHYKPFDPNKPMEELTQKLNASSMYFDIGLKVNINRWDDIRGPKRTAKENARAAKKEAKKTVVK